MIVSIGIFIALAIAVILYQKKKLPEWCMRKNSRNIFLMLLGVNSLAAYLFYVDQQAEFMGEHARLERNNCGEGVRTEKLIAKTGGREIPITIELPERQYNGKELEKAFETAMKKLDGIILDKNKTFDEVRKDLHFPSRILDMPITVSWEVDNYEVINVLGELQTEALKEEGTIVQITGKLKYGEEERIYMRNKMIAWVAGVVSIVVILMVIIVTMDRSSACRAGCRERKGTSGTKTGRITRDFRGKTGQLATSGGKQRICHFRTWIGWKYSSDSAGERNAEGRNEKEEKADDDRLSGNSKQICVVSWSRNDSKSCMAENLF